MKKILLFVIFFGLILTITFFIMNLLTPLIHDDYAYLYKFGPEAEVRPTTVAVKNIADVFESQYYHYLDVNGRFFSHFLIQLVLLFGKELFNMLNVLILLGLIFFICLYAARFKSGDKYPYLLLFIIVCIWFLSPFMGQTMLWLTGSIVYLWSSFFVVLFLTLFKREEQSNESPGYVKLLLFLIFSFLIGGTNESVTFGVAVALFIYAVFNFTKLNAALWVMTIGFGLGVLGIILSPGTFNRVDNEVVGDPSLYSLFLKKIISAIAILYLIKYTVLISLVLMLYLRIKGVSVIGVAKRETVILLSIAFNGMLMMLVDNIEERMVFGITVLWLLFNTVLLTKCLPFLRSSILMSISGVVLCFLGFSFYKSLSQVSNYNDKYFVFENQLKNKNQKVFYFPEFANSRFVYHTVGGVSDSRNYHNRIRGFYYALPEINILPEKLFRELFNYSLVKNEKMGCVDQKKKLHSLKTYGFTLFQLPEHFNYSETIMARIMFSDRQEKMFAVSVIPRMNNYYAIIKTDTLNLDSAISILLVNASGKVILKIK